MRTSWKVAGIASILVASLVLWGSPSLAAEPLEQGLGPTDASATGKGMTVAGVLIADPVLYRHGYAELEVGDPVREPGDDGYRNRTAEAVLRRGPVDSTGGIAPPFLEDTLWVNWTRESADHAPAEAETPGLTSWTVQLAGSTHGLDLELAGTWVPHPNPAEDCTAASAGPIHLTGTIGDHEATLGGQARDSTCVDGGSTPSDSKTTLVNP